MRNTGSRDKHVRYATPKQMQARANKLATHIDKFISQAYGNRSFRPLTDFDQLHRTKEALVALSKLKIDY